MRNHSRPHVSNDTPLSITVGTGEQRLANVERSDQVGQVHVLASVPDLLRLRILQQPTHRVDVFRYAEPVNYEGVDLELANSFRAAARMRVRDFCLTFALRLVCR